MLKKSRLFLKRLTALVLAAAVILGLGFLEGFEFPSAHAVTFNDTASHWAKTPIDRWTSYGVISGYSGNQFRPDTPIKRGELFKIIAETMNYKYIPSNPFSDINMNQWYYDYILKLVGAGVLNGSGGKVRPEDNITREEAFAVFARVFRVAADESGVQNFPDSDDCSYWARGEVGGMIRAGYVGGSDGRLNPKRSITRAEAVKILDNIVYGYISVGDTYNTDINGVVIINAPGAELHDMHVNGDLFITQGVGDGQVTLDNVIVDGDVYITGGGEHSVLIRGRSRVGTVYVKTTSATGPVRVSFSAPSEANTIAVENDSENVFIDGIVNRLLIARDTTVYVDNATVKSADLNGIGAQLRINENSTVKEARANAERTKIYAAGNLDYMRVNRGADGTQVEAGRSGQITQVEIWSSDVNVFGTGVLAFVNVEEGTGNRVTVSGAVVDVSIDAGGVKTGDAAENWIPPGETGQVGTTDLENALNVKKVTVLEDGSIQVEFSKELDKTKAQSAGNYKLSGDAVQYTADRSQSIPNYVEVSGSTVKLIFTGSSFKSLKSAETAVITVSNLLAKDGSPLGVKSGIYRKPSDDATLVSGKIIGSGSEYIIKAVDTNINWPDPSTSLGDGIKPELELTVTLPTRVAGRAELVLEKRSSLSKINYCIKRGTQAAPRSEAEYTESVLIDLSFNNNDRVYVMVTAADGKTKSFYKLNIKVIDQPSVESVKFQSSVQVIVNFINLDREKFVRFGQFNSQAGSTGQNSSSVWLPISNINSNGEGSLILDLRNDSDRKVFNAIKAGDYIFFGIGTTASNARDSDVKPTEEFCKLDNEIRNDGTVYFTTNGKLQVYGLAPNASYAADVERGSGGHEAKIYTANSAGMIDLGTAMDAKNVQIRRIYNDTIDVLVELGQPYVPATPLTVNLISCTLSPSVTGNWVLSVGGFAITGAAGGKILREDLSSMSGLNVGSYPIIANLGAPNTPGNFPTHLPPKINVTATPAEVTARYIDKDRIMFENSNSWLKNSDRLIITTAENVTTDLETVQLKAAPANGKVDAVVQNNDLKTTYDKSNYGIHTAYLINVDTTKNENSISKGVEVGKWVFGPYNWLTSEYTIKNDTFYSDNSPTVKLSVIAAVPAESIPATIQVNGVRYLTDTPVTSINVTSMLNSEALADTDTFTVIPGNGIASITKNRASSRPLVLPAGSTYSTILLNGRQKFEVAQIGDGSAIVQVGGTVDIVKQSGTTIWRGNTIQVGTAGSATINGVTIAGTARFTINIDVTPVKLIFEALPTGTLRSAGLADYDLPLSGIASTADINVVHIYGGKVQTSTMGDYVVVAPLPINYTNLTGTYYINSGSSAYRMDTTSGAIDLTPLSGIGVTVNSRANTTFQISAVSTSQVPANPFMTINPGSASVYTNETVQFSISFGASPLSTTDITWELITGGATLTSGGVFRAASAGTYEIRATSKTPGYTGLSVTAFVTVTEPPPEP